MHVWSVLTELQFQFPNHFFTQHFKMILNQEPTVIFLLFFVAQGMEPKAFPMLGELSIPELCLQLHNDFFFHSYWLRFLESWCPSNMVVTASMQLFNFKKKQVKNSALCWQQPYSLSLIGPHVVVNSQAKKSCQTGTCYDLLLIICLFELKCYELSHQILQVEQDLACVVCFGNAGRAVYYVFGVEYVMVWGTVILPCF